MFIGFYIKTRMPSGKVCIGAERLLGDSKLEATTEKNIDQPDLQLKIRFIIAGKGFKGKKL